MSGQAAAGGAPALDPDRAPIAVVDLDLVRGPVGAVDDGGGGGGQALLRGIGGDPVALSGAVLALVRRDGRPIGTVQTVLDPTERHPADAVGVLAALARSELMAELGDERAAEALPRPSGPPAATGAPPGVSVVIATRERPQLLARCLASLRTLRHPDFEVVVVDNAPVTEATRELVRQHAQTAPYDVRYVREPRPGLGRAHNSGLAAARGAVCAFTDDDVVVDPGWLDALADPFADPGVGCVTGLILPARLQTRTQVLLEVHGGFGKGFRGARYRLDRPPADQPLFPFTAGRFGSGANMAFRSDALRALGGFDPATGTGTRARGGDDLLAFFRILVHRYELVYRPEALVWHHHRDRPQDLEEQAFGYGAGLGAYLAAAVLNEPRMLPALLRRLPGGLRQALAETGAQAHPSWTRALSRYQRRGLLYGPIGYLHGRARPRGPTEARREPRTGIPVLGARRQPGPREEVDTRAG